MGNQKKNGHTTSEDLLDEHSDDLDNVLKTGLIIPPDPVPDTPSPAGDKPIDVPDLPVGDKPAHPTDDEKVA